MAFVLLGCSATGPSIDYDPQVRIDTYTTFNVARSENASIDPLNAERIEKAIVGNLTTKGYRFDPGGEFMAIYTIHILKNVPSNFSIGIGIGSYGHYGGGSLGTSVTPTSDKVKIRIDMIDNKAHKIFWSGAEETTMPTFTTPESRQKFFNAVIYRLLKTFPPKHRRRLGA